MTASEIGSNCAITPSQCRAARALLDWSMERLAGESGLPRRTLIRFEGSEGSPRTATIAAIRAALEAAGVQFIDENGGGAGVRLRKA
jgi:transcriptional regulator with XRE-family HTH domain